MNKKINNGVFYVAISLVAILAVGLVVVKAYSPNNTNVFESGSTYNNYEATQEVPEEFGVFPGPDVYEKMYFYDGIRAKSDIHLDLNTTATSSDEASPVMGAYCHKSNDPILITNWWLNITDNNSNWGFNPSIGTSSCIAYTGGGACVDYDINGTTTATLMAAGKIATSSVGIFTRDDIMNYVWNDVETGSIVETATLTPGTYYLDSVYGIGGLGEGATTTPFTLNTNDCIIISNAGGGGATSSNSFTTGNGGFDANFYGETVIK